MKVGTRIVDERPKRADAVDVLGSLKVIHEAAVVACLNAENAARPEFRVVCVAKLIDVKSAIPDQLL